MTAATLPKALPFDGPTDNQQLANLCGPVDENLRQIEIALDVELNRRGTKILVRGANAEAGGWQCWNDSLHWPENRSRSTTSSSAWWKRGAACMQHLVPWKIRPATMPVLRTKKADLQGRTHEPA